MEIFSTKFMTSLIIPFFLILLLIQTFKTLIKSTTSTTGKKLPPGPWKFPLIGSLIHLVGSQPHHALASLAKKHGPIIHLQLGQIPTVVISSPRLAKEALKTHDLAIANRPEYLVSKTIFYGSDLLFATYGKYWRQMYKISISELLSVKKVRSFRHIREEEVQHFTESIRSSAGAPFNLTKALLSLQNNIVCRATFGSKCKDRDALIEHILEIVAFLGSFDAADLFPSFKFLHYLSGTKSRMEKTHQKLDKILDGIISEHKENLGTGSTKVEEDLVNVLLRLEGNGGLEFPITCSNIKALTLDMFTAGTENASTTLEWAMSEVVRNTRVMKKVQAELRQVMKGNKEVTEADLEHFTYLKLIIKETLRLHNPSPLLFPRQCREEFEIDGCTIPVKTNIIFNFSVIARDPEYWHDPHSFLPERFENSSLDFKGANFEYIPFGAGRRICPGMSYTLVNIELALAQLLYQFDWKLPNGKKNEELDMSEIYETTVKRKNNLCLVATPCAPF